MRSVHIETREHAKQLVSRSIIVRTNLSLSLQPPSWISPAREHGLEFENGKR